MIIEQLQQVGESHDLIETLLSGTLVLTSLVGLVRSYRSLTRDNFDDSIFLEQQTDI